MNFVKDILKGAVMGVANIIPGVSGGTMAVSMGIYDRMIHAVTHLFSELKKSVKTLAPILVGMLLALGLMARLIEYLFGVVPFQTNLLFIGLILGGLPAIGKKVKGQGFHVPYLIAFVLFFALVVGCAALDGISGGDVDLSLGPINMLKLLGVGVIASATMVIPGVSGSMVLMILGYYAPIISKINQFVDHLKAFDVPGILGDCGVLVPFGVGVVVGIFAIAKVIEVVFAKWPTLAYWGIIGLIAASPVAILMLNLKAFGTITVVTVMTGVAALLAGVFVAMKLGEE